MKDQEHIPIDRRNNNQYDINKIASRYFKLGRNLKDGNVTADYVYEQFKDDVNYFVALKEANKITQVEFNSVLTMIAESEDMIEHIMNQLQELPDNE